MSKDKVALLVEAAAKNGELGEQIFDQWLHRCPLIDGTRVSSHSWIANDYATAPYDFEVTLETGQKIMIELKSTSGGHETSLYLSRAELELMAEQAEVDVVLARMCFVNDEPRVAFCYETATRAKEILAATTDLPDQTRFVAMEVLPSYYDFAEENIALPALEIQNSLF